MPSLDGIFPPIPTPFDRDGEVSIPRLKENLSAWNRYQLSGYVVLGSNGEASLIREKEKLALLEAAREGIPEDRAMIAGTGCQSTGATIRLTKDAADLGADFALVLPPYYYKAHMTGPVLERHYRAIADSSPIPILVYNIPATTGIDIPAETVGRLAEHENIVGMKDSSGSLVKFAEIRRLTPPSFKLLAGSASFLLPALALGGSGGILALANIAPAGTIELLRLFEEGKIDEARAIQLSLLPVNDAITRRFGVPALKAALDMLGMYGGPVRPPLLPLDDDKREELRRTLIEASILKEGR